MTSIKTQIADQLNSGIDPASIDGYDADRTAVIDHNQNHWERERSNPTLIYPVAAYPARGVWAMQMVNSGIWRVYDLAPDKASVEAAQIGSGYGVNGQIWDNA